MKKLAVLLALSPLFHVSFAADVIIRDNGGFFGYKYVTYTSDSQSSLLHCKDPGKSSCNRSNAVSSIGLTEFDFSRIDDLIYNELRNERNIGSFYYSSNYYVDFKFDLDLDKLIYTVYTLQEAKDANLI